MAAIAAILTLVGLDSISTELMVGVAGPITGANGLRRSAEERGRASGARYQCERRHSRQS
jgi:hypothetical protein